MNRSSSISPYTNRMSPDRDVIRSLEPMMYGRYAGEQQVTKRG